MGKPSIFSKEYDRKMKRRRRLVSSLVVILVVAVAVIFVTVKLNFSSDMKSKISSIFNNKQDNKPITSDKQTATKPKDDNTKPSASSDSNNKPTDTKENSEDKKQDEDKYIEVTLSTGTVSKVFYDEVSGVKKYKYLDPIDNGTSFDINPSQTSILINEASTQEIKIIDSSGQTKDVTRPSYVTKDGRTFSRETIMKQYPGYQWSVNAKFIDDTHVAYVSQLPWFGVKDLYSYIWIMDINTGEQQALMNTKAKTLIIETLAPEGLHIKMDDQEKILNAQGSIVG